MVAQEQRRYDEAETSYRQALDIYLEFGDRHGAAGTYHQLGSVAQEQRRFAEAETSYRQALDIYLEFGDRHSAGQHLPPARQGRRRTSGGSPRPRPATGKALDIYLEFGDRHSAAHTYHQLGRVAQEQRRFAEAEASYRQALDIYLDVNQRDASIVASRLGRVLSQLDRHAEAARTLLDAVVSRRQLIRRWDPVDLQWLKYERQLIGEATFTQMVTSQVPQDFQRELTTAINDADALTGNELALRRGGLAGAANGRRNSVLAIPPIGAHESSARFVVQGPGGIARRRTESAPLPAILQGFMIGRPGDGPLVQQPAGDHGLGPAQADVRLRCTPCARTFGLMMAASLAVRTWVQGKAPLAGSRRGLGVRAGGLVVSLT